MKKNVFTIVAFIALSTFQQLAAQPFPLSPSVYKQFSPSVAKAVYNKLSRISTSTSTQLWLANAFVKRDSIIALQMVKGLSPKEIKKATDSLTLQLENGLKATMSNTEKKAYLDKIEVPRLEKEKYVGAAMNSQFVIALKNKTALGLSKSQDDRLLEKAKEYKKKCYLLMPTETHLFLIGMLIKTNK